MQERRPLKIEDVIRPGSEWEAALADLCRQQLRTADRADYLYDDRTLRQAITGVIKNVDNWSLDLRGLTIEFPEYSVAARSAGSFSVSLAWRSLRPYLARGFDPAMLPQPIHQNTTSH